VSRNQTRRLTDLLILAGVVPAETAKGPKISDDIQLTYQVDDLSLLAAPLRRPVFYATEVSPAVAVVRGIIELHATPNAAIIVPWFRNDDAGQILTWNVVAATGITANLATIAPDVSLGGVSRALFQEGTGAPAVGLRLAAAAELPPNFPPLVLRPGDILQFRSELTNDAVEVTLAWREIPVIVATD